MAEEQRWQEPGSHRLCANNCGFFGSPATLNLCSKCYRDYCVKEQQMKDVHIAVETTLRPSGSAFSSSPPSASSSPKSAAPAKEAAQAAPVAADPVSAPKPNRCSACNKRVGLTGFTCKCGATFCGSHRYPEKHGCGFDYKAVGREAIAKANPVIKAEKLDKI